MTIQAIARQKAEDMRGIMPVALAHEVADAVAVAVLREVYAGYPAQLQLRLAAFTPAEPPPQETHEEAKATQGTGADAESLLSRSWPHPVTATTNPPPSHPHPQACPLVAPAEPPATRTDVACPATCNCCPAEPQTPEPLDEQAGRAQLADAARKLADYLQPAAPVSSEIRLAQQAVRRFEQLEQDESAVSSSARPDRQTVEQQLRALAGATYQLAGVVGAPVRFLDALSAAANGDAFSTDGLLPVLESECGHSEQADARPARTLEDAFRAGWDAANVYSQRHRMSVSSAFADAALAAYLSGAQALTPDAALLALSETREAEAFKWAAELQRVYAGNSRWEWFHEPSGGMFDTPESALAAYRQSQGLPK